MKRILGWNVAVIPTVAYRQNISWLLGDNSVYTKIVEFFRSGLKRRSCPDRRCVIPSHLLWNERLISKKLEGFCSFVTADHLTIE